MRRMTKNFAALAVVAMVAAACGGDDASDAPAEEPAAEESAEESAEEEAAEEPAEEPGGAASEEETAEAVEEAMSDDGDDAEEADALPTTLEGWQELWASERADVVAAAEAEGWGLGDDGILVGPAGFTIDTNECPEGWNNDEGLDDGVITIGVQRRSGSLAVYGNIYTGLGAYFDMINDQGGIGGYTFEVIVKDDDTSLQRPLRLGASSSRTEATCWPHARFT